MREGRAHRLRSLLFVAIGVVTAAAALALYAAGTLDDPELDTVDARFSIRGEVEPPDDVIVVAIDDVTFDELELRWPFRRSVHARLIDRIAAQEPRAIAFDVQFSEPSAPRRQGDDIALAEAILDAGRRVVLATTEVNRLGEAKLLGAGPALQREIGARMGNALLPTDPGGVNRRVPYEVGGLKSFAVQVAEVASGRGVDPDSLGDEATWIDFHGPPGTIPSVPYSRVLRAETEPGLLRDKIVVIGPSAPSLQDVHPTSTSGDDLMAGAELQANAISTVRRGFPLESVSVPLEVALIALLALVAPAASLRLSPMRALAVAIAAGAAYAVASQLAFNSGAVIPVVYPLGGLALATVGSLGAHYVTAAIERERMRDLFGRFVPEDVVDEVLTQAGGLRLGGVQREGTVMFSDLRGFTSFAESIPVERVIDILNRYLTAMSDAILDHGGTLVAYMGDGIMAVFGAPVQQDDHADRALAAAREMLERRLPDFNAWLREEGLGEGFRMGIGLNSGDVMSGNVGSERRLEYTAIGDTTNTASRIEGMTKGTPHQLLLADSTRELLRDPPADLVLFGELEVRGRQAKVRLWSVAEGGDGAAPPGDERAAGQPA